MQRFVIVCGAAALAMGLLACDKPAPEAASAPAPSDAAAPGQGDAVQAKGLPDRDPALARRLVRDEGALLLDVRTPEEFEAGHVEGAVLIPHDALPERIEEVVSAQGGDKTKPIVVYCKSGGRAGIAKETLLENGFENVTNLGGVSDWCEDCSE